MRPSSSTLLPFDCLVKLVCKMHGNGCSLLLFPHNKAVVFPVVFRELDLVHGCRRGAASMLWEEPPRLQFRHQGASGGEDDRDTEASFKGELDYEDVRGGRNLNRGLGGRRKMF